MLRSAVLVMLAVVASSVFQAHAAEQSHTSTIKHIYTQPNGDFILIFDTSHASCTDIHPDKYFGVAIGSNGVTAEGSRKLYGLALTAFALGKPMTITFDDSTWNCYVIRASINPV